MSDTLRVAVIGGGQNSEHDVSLASARSIGAALASLGHAVVALTVGRDGRWQVDDRGIDLATAVSVLAGCDVAVPALHGPRGEDGTAAAGVATAPGVLVGRAAAARYTWTRPVVVKPVAAGSSHGVTLVDTPQALGSALTAAFALDDRVLIEEMVVGREIDVAVLGEADGSRTVAPTLEIVCAGLFDTATKYDGSADFLIPAPLADADRVVLEETAVAVYDALGCRGVARVDFFWTDRGPVLNEVNTMPGFTAHSQVPKMFAAAGVSYAQLVDRLVRDAAGRLALVPV